MKMLPWMKAREARLPLIMRVFSTRIILHSTNNAMQNALPRHLLLYVSL